MEQLNEYYDASFYNMIMYGADMLDVEQESRYIIENYECKNLIVNVYIDNAMHYDEEENPLTYSVHSKAAEDGFLDRAEYYLRYLKAKPTYAVDKLRSWYKDTYLNQTFDVFNAETGAYDKTRRDAERISDRESYLKAYPEFANYPQTSPEMTEIESTAESLARIRISARKRELISLSSHRRSDWNISMIFQRKRFWNFTPLLRRLRIFGIFP